MACFKIATVLVSSPPDQVDAEGFPISRADSAAISSTGPGHISDNDSAAAAAHISTFQHGEFPTHQMQRRRETSMKVKCMQTHR